jgi:cell division protein ftsA
VANIFYKSKPIIGLDINKAGVRVMSVDMARMTVHGYGAIELDPAKDESDDRAEYLCGKINQMFEKNIVGRLGSNRVVLGLPTTKTYARTFALPIKQENKIEEAVNLEVEQYVPMPLDSLYVDHQIIKRGKENLSVLMCAVPQKIVDEQLAIVESCGIEVAMIEPSINAVARLLERTKEGSLPTVIVDIGPATTDIAILDAAIRVTGGLNIGGNTLTLDIAKKLNVPLETAHQFKVLNGLNTGPRQEKITEALRPSLQRIIGEIQKVIRYYTDRFPDESRLEQVLIVGSGSSVPGLGEYFTGELTLPARVASPWQSLNFNNLAPPAKQLRPRFMTAAGLSLVRAEEIWHD